jgi:hypothetical protein
MVGVCAASWLQRDGHSVFLVEAGEPGHGASFGNAGCFNGSSVTPVSMPGVIRNVPRWLFYPLGPLSLRWSYLPTIAPWLVRFMRAGMPEKVRAQASALRPLVGPTLEALRPLVAAAGAEDLVHRLGHLYVYRSEESLNKDGLAWELRRENGVEIENSMLTNCVSSNPPCRAIMSAGCWCARTGTPRTHSGSLNACSRSSCAWAASSCMRGPTDFVWKTTGLPRSKPTPAICRPMLRSSAPGRIRSRSLRHSATEYRSKPSAAIT